MVTLFLANIQPSLQLHVLNQLSDSVSLVVADTMNLWIDTDLKGLNEVISKSNIFLLNDEEANQLTGCSDLTKAGEYILEQGSKHRDYKNGFQRVIIIRRRGFISCSLYARY